jgi:hypothetical protein
MVPATGSLSGRFQVMTYEAHGLRNLLSLARMLRGFAEEHAHDNNHALFLSTAVALEERAHFIANAEDTGELEHDTAIHAPVDMVV